MQEDISFRETSSQNSISSCSYTREEFSIPQSLARLSDPAPLRRAESQAASRNHYTRRTPKATGTSRHCKGLDPVSQTQVTLYHPRQQAWQDHFGWSARMLELVNWSKLMVGTQNAANPVATTPEPAEQRLALHNVSWETYEKLLDAFGEHRAAHLTYDGKVLEFMVPLEAHENPSDLIGDFIKMLTVESGLEIKSLASTTLKRADLQKGAEPDKCYYIQNEPLVRGKTVNLEQDPPPDLVVEVDITHTDIDKNTLYAQMGVPEFWRFNGKTLRIYQLSQGTYQEVAASPTIPWVPKEVFYHFLEQCRTQGESQALRELRAWVQATCQAPPTPRQTS